MSLGWIPNAISLMRIALIVAIVLAAVLGYRRVLGRLRDRARPE